MKTNLFYFSATGNSLIVAKDIAAKFPEAQIFSIPYVLHENLDCSAENIGIIFPVYYFGMPRIVVDFIAHFPFHQAKYIFAVCTYGGMAAGTLLQTQKQLQGRDLTLNAGFGIQMPGNYVVKYGPARAEKQNQIFRKEKTKVEAIVDAIQNQQNHKIERNNSFINWIGNIAYKKMSPKFPTLDQNFIVNEKCNGCTTCEKVCPVANIQIADGRPRWQGRCEHCLACIQWCPQEAIQYGPGTVRRKRYHHPEVGVKELYRSF